MKILLIGYGTMNQRVARLAEEKGHEIVGTIEPEEHQHSPYKAYHHIADAQNEADVAIDFSNPNLLLPLLDEEFELPLVIATTGEKETDSKIRTIKRTYACFLQCKYELWRPCIN